MYLFKKPIDRRWDSQLSIIVRRRKGGEEHITNSRLEARKRGSRGNRAVETA